MEQTEQPVVAHLNTMSPSSSSVTTTGTCCGMCGACGAMPPWAPERIATLSREERAALESRMLAAQLQFKRLRDLRLLRLREQQEGVDMCPLAARVGVGTCDDGVTAVALEESSGGDDASGSGVENAVQGDSEVDDDKDDEEEENGVLQTNAMSDLIVVNLSSSSSATSSDADADAITKPREANSESMSVPSRPLQHVRPPSRRMHQQEEEEEEGARRDASMHVQTPNETTAAKTAAGTAVSEKARERNDGVHVSAEGNNARHFAAISKTTDADFESDADSFHTAGSDDDTVLPSSVPSASASVSHSHSHSNSNSPSFDDDGDDNDDINENDSHNGYVLIGDGISNGMDEERLADVTEDVNNAFADFSHFENPVMQREGDAAATTNSTSTHEAFQQSEDQTAFVSMGVTAMPLSPSSSTSEDGGLQQGVSTQQEKGTDTASASLANKFDVITVDGLGDTTSNTDDDIDGNVTQGRGGAKSSSDNLEEFVLRRRETATGRTKRRPSGSPLGRSPPLRRSSDHRRNRTRKAQKDDDDDDDDMAVVVASRDVVQCRDCRKWRRRVQELEAHVETVTTLLAEREMENATLKARLDDRERSTPRNEARLHQENASLRVTMDFLSQRLETYERCFKDRKGDVH